MRSGITNLSPISIWSPWIVSESLFPRSQTRAHVYLDHSGSALRRRRRGGMGVDGANPFELPDRPGRGIFGLTSGQVCVCRFPQQNRSSLDRGRSLGADSLHRNDR